MPDRPVVYGAAYSVYVQAVRLTLWAKKVPYDLVEVDVFAPSGPPTEHFARHPFGRIPAFAHGRFQLYETAPICRYIDEAFSGPKLQPATPIARAVVGQAISIMDNYAYRSMVWGVYTERIEKPARGIAPDAGALEVARERSNVCLKALEDLQSEHVWLAGSDLSLADLHAAPMFGLFMKTPDAAELMRPYGRMSTWWRRIEEHVRPAQII
jgi:glutathione S-transferase